MKHKNKKHALTLLHDPEKDVVGRMRPFGIELDLEDEEAYVLMDILEIYNGCLNKEQQHVADYVRSQIHRKLFEEGN